MGKTNVLSQHLNHKDGARDNNNVVLLKLELFTIWALKGMTMEKEEQDISREIQRRNLKREYEDAVATKALGNAGERLLWNAE